jgi:magnesium transporter
VSQPHALPNPGARTHKFDVLRTVVSLIGAARVSCPRRLVPATRAPHWHFRMDPDLAQSEQPPITALDVPHGSTSQESNSSGLVACTLYADGHRVAELAPEEIGQPIHRDEGFVWIGLYEPSQPLLQLVQQQFGLHDLAIEDAHRAHQRPKLEQYHDSVFVVIRTAQFASGSDEKRLEFGETHVFVGADYVVTVRHGSVRSHTELRARCEASPSQLVQGPGYVLYALMDFLVDQYFPIVQELEDQVADIEEMLFSHAGESTSRETVAEIYRLKRDLLSLKRTVAPLIDVCNRLVRFDVPLIPPRHGPISATSTIMPSASTR